MQLTEQPNENHTRPEKNFSRRTVPFHNPRPGRHLGGSRRDFRV